MINKFFQSWMMIGKINFSLSSIFEVIFNNQKFYWNQFIITPYWSILIEKNKKMKYLLTAWSMKCHVSLVEMWPLAWLRQMRGLIVWFIWELEDMKGPGPVRDHQNERLIMPGIGIALIKTTKLASCQIVLLIVDRVHSYLLLVDNKKFGNIINTEMLLLY